jgi:hypothetical protein
VEILTETLDDGLHYCSEELVRIGSNTVMLVLQRNAQYPYKMVRHLALVGFNTTCKQPNSLGQSQRSRWKQENITWGQGVTIFGKENVERIMSLLSLQGTLGY